MTSPSRRVVPAIAVSLGVLTLLLYLPTVGHEFVVVDDGTYIYENPYVRAGLSLRGLVWAFTTFHAANWHPLTWLSHMLDVSLFGMDPGGHHLVGALLHATSAALLLLLLYRMTGAVWRSGFVAALFALHPLRVESVAWAAERKDQLATLFCMLTLLAYVRYARRPGAGRYAVVALLLALGLMAKPMLVTLPLVMLLLDAWPLRRAGRKLLVEKVPLFALCAVSAVVTVLAQRAGAAVRSLQGYPPGTRILNAAESYVVYLWQTIWPRGLTVHYPYPATAAEPWLPGLSALLGLAAVTGLLLRYRRRHPGPAVGWLWYLVTLTPVIGIVQVGTQAHADRYTYLPSIGLYVGIAWGASAWLERRPAWRRPARVIAVGACIACLPLSWAQIAHWRDSVTLFRHAVRVTPDDTFSRLNYAVSLLDAGRADEAEHELRALLALDPDNPRAHFNLGNLERERGDDRAAELAYRTALRLDPTHAPTRVNLGLLLLDRGALRESMELFCEAARLAADSVEAKVNCANALVLAGDDQRAASLYRDVLVLEPGNVPARLGLARRWLESGRGDEGLDLLDRLLRERPDLAAAHLLRGLELESRGRVAEARAAYREVLRLDPGNSTARRRLGMSAESPPAR